MEGGAQKLGGVQNSFVIGKKNWGSKRVGVDGQKLFFFTVRKKYTVQIWNQRVEGEGVGGCPKNSRSKAYHVIRLDCQYIGKLVVC